MIIRLPLTLAGSLIVFAAIPTAVAAPASLAQESDSAESPACVAFAPAVAGPDPTTRWEEYNRLIVTKIVTTPTSAYGRWWSPNRRKLYKWTLTNGSDCSGLSSGANAL